jgi:hypothetical protein
MADNIITCLREQCDDLVPGVSEFRKAVKEDREIWWAVAFKVKCQIYFSLRAY